MKDGWIDKRERPPTQKDADPWNCVIVWHRYQGCMITGWKYAVESDLITHWRHTFPKPEALRKTEEDKNGLESLYPHNQ